jgi:excisionase family DNA binding protein
MKQEKEVLRRLESIERLLEERKTKPLNLVEAARYLSISQSHLYKLTSQRKIPSHKPNGKYLYFFKEELDEWIVSSEKEKGKGQKVEAQDVETDASTPLSTGDEDEEPP